MEIKYLKDCSQFIPVIAGLIHAEWGFLYPARTVADLVNALKKNLNTDRVPLTLVAVENERLVGTVGLEEFDMDTRMEYSPWLVSLYVIPDYRQVDEHRKTGVHQQVARQLVERATETAWALGVKTLYLYTLKPHAGFYESRGWRVLEKMVYKNRPVTVLALDLSRSGTPFRS
jgi:predicted N-acetyltransferase YhbS